MVSVKPLNWQRREPNINVAVDPNRKDRYTITEYSGMSEPFKVEFLGCSTEYFKTFEDARLACNEDYVASVSNLIE